MREPFFFYELIIMGNEPVQNSINTEPSGFGALGINEKILQVLAAIKFTVPTPIQHKAIPIAIAGKDVMGIAQTGTGKTLAFGLPMIQRLAAMPGKKGIVVLPTRELALQVDEMLQKVGRGFGLKTAVLIGGTGMGPQISALRRNPHIVIGTPGRINDHLERKTLQLSNVAMLVLDEADHMFDMGFLPQIKKIITHIPDERQTMLFSATMPSEILKLATAYMKLPLRIEIAPQGTTAERVEQEIFFTGRDQRMPLLQKLLGDLHGSVLVFLRTKHNAKKICRQLLAADIPAAEIHSNRSLSQRRAALDGFKSGKYRVLVATDIAARGIDVKGIGLVVNYDLPENSSDYVHRIGRTGRAGQAGRAISFALPDQRSKVREIERLIRNPISVTPLPGGLPQVAPVPYEKPYQHQRTGYQGKRPFQKTFRKPFKRY